MLRMKKFALSILIFWIIAVLAGRLLQLNPHAIDLNVILSNPTTSHLFGSDDLGRDILARILSGVEVSFIVALIVTVVTMGIGVFVGLLAGFYGGRVDAVLMQITDVFLAFPGMFNGLGELCAINPRTNHEFTKSSARAGSGIVRGERAALAISTYTAAIGLNSGGGSRL
jgi:peptide/nickel transport system permease protein